VLAASAAYSILGENPLRITMSDDALSVYSGSNAVLRYRYRNVPFKPCVQQLFSPAGVNILRDAPADHLHHHALMFAVTVDGVNFWEEQAAPGRQLHREFDDVRVNKRDDTAFAGFTEHVDWLNPATKELLLEERRTVEVLDLNEPDVTLLTWRSAFTLAEGKESAAITGAHYHGLGMRFVQSMDNGGEFRNADGKAGTVFRGDERLVRSKWCAYSAKADGRDVTVVMFDHPDNERHPATWFTMTAPFAYLSATLNLHEEPLMVVASKPVILRYGVALWDGKAETNQIEDLYERWVAQEKNRSN
jgi:hypothetical protein